MKSRFSIIIESDQASIIAPCAPILSSADSHRLYAFDENTHFTPEPELTATTNLYSKSYALKPLASDSNSFGFFSCKSPKDQSVETSQEKMDLKHLPNYIEQESRLKPTKNSYKLSTYDKKEKALKFIFLSLNKSVRILTEQNLLTPKLAKIFTEAQHHQDLPGLINSIEETLKISPRPWYACFTKVIKHPPQTLALCALISGLKYAQLDQKTAAEFALNTVALHLATPDLVKI